LQSLSPLLDQSLIEKAVRAIGPAPGGKQRKCEPTLLPYCLSAISEHLLLAIL